jgi:hypothetical protein
MSVAALAILAVGCNKNGGEDGPATNTDLVGKWFIQLKDEIMGAGFLADGKGQAYNEETGQWETAGTWSYENGVLTTQGEGRESKFKASLYNGKTVLILKEADDELGNYTLFFYRDGKSSASDAGVLQGTWDWFAFGPGMPRIRFVFSGNNFDLIIPVWGDRYKGTFTYKDGYATMKVTECMTSRIPHGNYDEDTLNYDEATGDISGTWSTTIEDWAGNVIPYTGPLVSDDPTKTLVCAFAVVESKLAYAAISGMGLRAELTKTK